MPSNVESSEATSSVNVPKPFGYFFAGLIVGGICVLLPFLFVLPIMLNQAHAGDQLHAQLTQKDVEIAELLQQIQNRPPPPQDHPPHHPPFQGAYPPPPRPANEDYARPPERPPYDNY